MQLLSLATFGVLFFANAALAAPLPSYVGNVASEFRAPEEQGWAKSNWNGSVMTGEEYGPDAWRVNDASSGGRGWYQTVIPSSSLEFLDIRSGGWELSGRVGVLDLLGPNNAKTIQFTNQVGSNPDLTQFYFQRFDMTFGVVGSDVRVRIEGNSALKEVVVSSDGPLDGFHDYALRYNPATKLATFYVNDVSTGLTTAGVNIGPFSPTALAQSVRFGSVDNGAIGDAAYANVALKAASTSTILAGYDFQAGLAASLDVSGNSIAMAMTGGTVGYGFDASAHSVFVPTDLTPSSQDAALASGYFSFTVAPEISHKLNLESLYAEVGLNGADNSTVNWFVRSSLDNFGSDLGSLSVTSTNNGHFYQPLWLDLSDAQFQGLTEAVEFRLYVFDNLNNSSIYARLDNVVLRGSVEAIPEPATLALLGSGGLLGALALRRRVAT